MDSIIFAVLSILFGVVLGFILKWALTELFDLWNKIDESNDYK